MVSLNFESGWFSPMDIEVPTIHSVEFFNTDNWNVMNITEVPPVLFSEAMRDIDLLVSAAHYGSVDRKQVCPLLKCALPLSTCCFHFSRLTMLQ